jgi:phenylalanyl-tRNA synthetase beta chain
MTGQPTHAYDKKIVGKSFSIKYLNKKIKIFGNKEVELKNNLVITSDQKPVSLAGIIGFEKTSITNKTQEFILEFGQFKIKDIRNSLKTIKINSNAGFQSSKVISNGTLKYAIDYVKTKLNNFSEVVNFKEKPKKEIVFSKQKLNKITGFKITDEKKYKESINSLKKLGFEFKDQFVKIPTYRHDLESQQDINEEILRYYGYNLLPSIKNPNHFIEVTKINNIKNFLIAQGYYEVMTYSLISEQKNIYKPFDFKETIKLKTFVSKERELIRDSQIFSILEVIDYNQKNNIKDINIFSEGMVNNGVKTLILASTTKTFNLVKQDLVNLFSQKIEFKVSKNKNMHPGYSADIYLNNNKIGLIGKVNPKNSKIDAIIAEIYFEDYFLEIEYKKYDNNPLKSIDITFSLNLKENIEDKIKNIVAFNSKIIDATKIKNIKKVTVRFLGTQDQIKEINSKYNK